MVKFKWFKTTLITAALFSTSAFAFEPQSQREDREPEAATGLQAKQAVTTNDYMVVAAHPLASRVGYNILKKGGTAIDAAIAVQVMLTLVEPQSSGIGGGAFILYWDKKKRALTTYDGRETAPAAADSDLFLKEDGTPVSWREAIVGGRSVGVPGVLAALKMAHDKHGHLPWKELFADAIRIAEKGFRVSPRLAKLVSLELNPGVEKISGTRQYFYPDSYPIKENYKLKNQALADVYKTIASEGIKPFYQGDIAKQIVETVQKSPIAPGKLSLEDMANYKPVEREPLCSTYREYKVCGMDTPSSGGFAVLQMLSILEPFELSKRDFLNTQTLHLFTQSSRLAFADRDKYVADADFVHVPKEGLLDKKYLQERAKLIDLHVDMGKASPGIPAGATAMVEGDAYELPSTSHISIVDKYGNALSMTTSIEMAFGSGLMSQGFLLNNQLTDFSLSPKKDGKWVANRVEPNKRPRSSMSPIMVFDKYGNLKLVVGSPGGSRIINYVAQTVLGVLDWNLDPQEAINLPRITNRNKVTTLEKGTDIERFKSSLEAKGHKVFVRDLNSGIHAIEVKSKSLVGGADPRREGKVLGD